MVNQMKKIIQGKVREVYEVSDKALVVVTTDRISAFDVILPSPAPCSKSNSRS